MSYRPADGGLFTAEVEMEKMSNGLFFPKDKSIGADYEVVSKAHTSPLDFLPEWIVQKIRSGDRAWEANCLPPMNL